ncbi:MAG: gamma-glutamylcyclotransferase [Gammaproteobacteria bacterium]|nr:gamma-glutamylcyclotransferase [Gammaproteobacteria bacterium]
MTVYRYFAYGSNVLAARLAARVAIDDDLGTAVLTGWSLRFHKRGRDGSAKCDIVSTGNPDDRVYGAVYELNANAKVSLDGIEGAERGYTTLTLALPPFGPVYFYRADPRYTDASLLPFQWYLDLVIEGGRQRKFPADYLQPLAAQPTLPNPPRMYDYRSH